MLSSIIRKSSFTSVALLIISHLCQAQRMPQLPPNQLLIPQADQRIAIVWKGDSMGTVWNPHAAMLIPVKLPHCPRQFYMQFDLGSPYSMFYKNKLEEISQRYPESVRLVDSSKALAKFRFRLHRTEISAREMALREYNGKAIAWDKKELEIIGTIGADLIENKTIVINYPGKYILLSNSDKHTANLPLSDFMFERRAVLLPAAINGKKLMLYFDTGSSAFELLTSKETALALARPETVPVRYTVRSWNNTLVANTVPTGDSIDIAMQRLPLVTATYMENVSDNTVSQMMKMGIGGMTGNKLFLKHVLVLDTRNRKFAVYSPSRISR